MVEGLLHVDVRVGVAEVEVGVEGHGLAVGKHGLRVEEGAVWAVELADEQLARGRGGEHAGGRGEEPGGVRRRPEERGGRQEHAPGVGRPGGRVGQLLGVGGLDADDVDGGGLVAVEGVGAAPREVAVGVVGDGAGIGRGVREGAAGAQRIGPAVPGHHVGRGRRLAAAGAVGPVALPLLGGAELGAVLRHAGVGGLLHHGRLALVYDMLVQRGAQHGGVGVRVVGEGLQRGLARGVVQEGVGVVLGAGLGQLRRLAGAGQGAVQVGGRVLGLEGGAAVVLGGRDGAGRGARAGNVLRGAVVAARGGVAGHVQVLFHRVAVRLLAHGARATLAARRHRLTRAGLHAGGQGRPAVAGPGQVGGLRGQAGGPAVRAYGTGGLQGKGRTGGGGGERVVRALLRVVGAELVRERVQPRGHPLRQVVGHGVVAGGRGGDEGGGGAAGRVEAGRGRADDGGAERGRAGGVGEELDEARVGEVQRALHHAALPQRVQKARLRRRRHARLRGARALLLRHLAVPGAVRVPPGQLPWVLPVAGVAVTGGGFPGLEQKHPPSRHTILQHNQGSGVGRGGVAWGGGDWTRGRGGGE